jgi:hypothetical protein
VADYKATREAAGVLNPQGTRHATAMLRSILFDVQLVTVDDDHNGERLVDNEPSSEPPWRLHLRQT